MPPRIVSIYIATPPNKTNYFEGEYFNPAGMVVKARLSNGTSQTVTTYFYNPQSALTTSDTIVTISYQLFSVTQSIVVNPVLTIGEYPNKLNYHVDESFDPTGMVVLYYSGGLLGALSGPGISLSGVVSSTLLAGPNSALGISIELIIELLKGNS